MVKGIKSNVLGETMYKHIIQSKSYKNAKFYFN